MTVELTTQHPGEVLSALYLEPLEISAGALSKKLHVPRTRIERLVKGQTAMSSETALRLSRFFNTTPQYWMNMQTNFDLQNEALASSAELAEIEQLKAS
ncbi:MAG: HigA family addiction module antitoxin [Rhizobiaceae bacterium]